MRYRVKLHSEQFSCPACGFPVLIYCSAWRSPATGIRYCAEACADDAEAEAQRAADAELQRPLTPSGM